MHIEDRLVKLEKQDEEQAKRILALESQVRKLFALTDELKGLVQPEKPQPITIPAGTPVVMVRSVLITCPVCHSDGMVFAPFRSVVCQHCHNRLAVLI